MCFYALAADFAAGAVAPALPIMEYQFQPHQSISRLSQLVAVSLFFFAFFAFLRDAEQLPMANYCYSSYTGLHTPPRNQ
jgi:hypothetical protein